jgi:hypothetical protein
MPACTNASAFSSQTFHGLALAPPAVLPAPDFVGDGFYAHMEPASVPAASKAFAETLQSRANLNPR